MNRRGPLPGLRAGLLALACSAGLGLALSPAQASQPSAPPIELVTVPPSQQESGLEIYQRFRDGLAEPQCDAAATGPRWKKHFAHAPSQLVKSDDVLPLFGYVVDALREAHLPTEFALIPFVESGYKPGARNASGPAGLWQFIGITARNHGVPVRESYDGRLSPVDSTQAAVRYLKTLHGMFGGDWRLAVMAYNAGEYRVLQSMRRAGMNAQNARPAELPGLSSITYAYVEKLHALACIFEQADDRGEWLKRLDRPVPRLSAHALPRDAASLERWAEANGHDSALLKRLNPALGKGVPRLDKPVRILAPDSRGIVAASSPRLADAPVEAESGPDPSAAGIGAASASPPSRDTAVASASRRSHTVRAGESAWTIARRYGLRPQQLLSRNGLKSDAILRPGMVLALDESQP
ncbi:lytic transglycosylase domain-containing protein [Pseudoxanthomonas beigongshangi]|uniref:lytic transglycosylase domain-containing protein n=1 Tax=Pseudoxanthomonas beigongshangi TaxID=2782537 RepID=UPI00193C195A|nr:lytic transglycosylase domain-containing protein [Pseudoxanthomonas beigongshangi]